MIHLFHHVDNVCLHIFPAVSGPSANTKWIGMLDRARHTVDYSSKQKSNTVSSLVTGNLYIATLGMFSNWRYVHNITAAERLVLGLCQAQDSDGACRVSWSTQL